MESAGSISELPGTSLRTENTHATPAVSSGSGGELFPHLGVSVPQKAIVIDAWLKLDQPVDRQQNLIAVLTIMKGPTMPGKPIAAHFRTDEHIGMRSHIQPDRQRVKVSFKGASIGIPSIGCPGDSGSIIILEPLESQPCSKVFTYSVKQVLINAEPL